MLWWMKNGEDTQGLARFLSRLDRLAFGMRILAIGGSKRRRRFDARRPLENHVENDV